MLSGGERGRLHLAKTLMQGGNVLLLDEPSNDLDVETLRALEDALLEFAGSVMVISHDRWFLDRICTHILAAEDEPKPPLEGMIAWTRHARIDRVGRNTEPRAGSRVSGGGPTCCGGGLCERPSQAIGLYLMRWGVSASVPRRRWRSAS